MSWWPGVLAPVVWKYEQGLPDYSQLKEYEPPVMTRVHAADGSLLAEYSRERRLYLPSAEIPDLVKHAFISAEDREIFATGALIPKGSCGPALSSCKVPAAFRAPRPSLSKWPRTSSSTRTALSSARSAGSC